MTDQQVYECHDGNQWKYEEVELHPNLAVHAKAIVGRLRIQSYRRCLTGRRWKSLRNLCTAVIIGRSPIEGHGRIAVGGVETCAPRLRDSNGICMRRAVYIIVAKPGYPWARLNKGECARKEAATELAGLHAEYPGPRWRLLKMESVLPISEVGETPGRKRGGSLGKPESSCTIRAGGVMSG